jgi:hypothetical protein
MSFVRSSSAVDGDERGVRSSGLRADDWGLATPMIELASLGCACFAVAPFITVVCAPARSNAALLSPELTYGHPLVASPRWRLPTARGDLADVSDVSAP